MFMDQTPLHHVQDVFDQIIRRLLLLSKSVYTVSTPMESTEQFYKFCCPQSSLNCPLRLNAVISLIYWFGTLSKRNDSLHRVLIGARVIDLLKSSARFDDHDGSPPKTSSSSLGTDLKDDDHDTAYRSQVLSLAWLVFLQPDPDLRNKILSHALSRAHKDRNAHAENIGKEHIYSWIR
ncbi:hypothetical protein GYMLUDRAFT_589452 [Collybiopsis luxurians FD-317 M1]|uniref:Uncharacterized protein n=1 Tax=Collybiopsis luxurians FD-317 M1 TaxID=944289 RepID=A0A0D0BBM6_9AGAR|nr:hypothetical protein GYMLUDRAFT_589452 [Collybiopsis luxurians FD-317 M1]